MPPPLLCLVCHQRHLTSLRLICSPPEVNPATARLPGHVPTFSAFRAPRRAQKKITNKLYLFFNLSWNCPPHKAKNPRYRHNVLTTLAFLAAPLILNVATLPPISLYLTEYLPPIPLVVPSYARLKARAKQHTLTDWYSDPTSDYYPYPPTTQPHPLMGLGRFVAGRIHQMRSGKSYRAAPTSWENPDHDTTCPLCSDVPQSFEHAILSCPSTAGQRSRLLQGLSDLGPEAPMRSDQQRHIGLAEFIRVTATGFALGMPQLPPLLGTLFFTLSPPPPYLPCVLESS